MNRFKDRKIVEERPDYTIDSDGVVYGKRNNVIKHDITHDGYHRVTLYKDKKAKHYPVHRLVAKAFIPNPEGKETVNHIDGDKSNNNVSNLEWSTRSENSQHAYDTQLNRCHFTDEDRRKAGRSKAERSSKPVKIVETGVIYNSVSECARVNNLDTGNIAACCNGKRKAHHGLHFEYVDRKECIM